MTLKIYLATTLSLFFTACATTHPGQSAKTHNNTNLLPLKVSAQTIEGKKEDAFQLIELTFENTSDEWVRIQSGNVIIKNPAETKVSVILGRDLKDWANAMSFRIKKEQYNDELIQGGVAVAAGATSMIGSHNGSNTVKAIGDIALIGTLAWAVSDTINRSYKSAVHGDTLPENHFYQPFSVPGKMFTRRWVLLNKPVNRFVTPLWIEVENIEGKKEIYEIAL